MSGWTGLRYLEEWSGIAKAFDIATGYFEIGALLALDGKWQPLEKMRILMGAEMPGRYVGPVLRTLSRPFLLPIFGDFKWIAAPFSTKGLIWATASLVQWG